MSILLSTISGSTRERCSRSHRRRRSGVTSTTAGTWRISRNTSKRCRSSIPSRQGSCTVHCSWSVMSSRKAWILPAEETASACETLTDARALLAIAEPCFDTGVSKQRHNNRYEQCSQVF